MLFNSVSFIFLFMPIFLFVLGKLKGITKIIWIVTMSFAFYSYVGKGWFILPMLATTTIDYYLAIKIHNTASENRKRIWLFLSLFASLSFLFYFKYSLFFVQSVFDLHLSEATIRFLSVALPVGISFYTFQSISYVIDVYNGKVEPETNFWMYASFVSFFPSLLAGPISRHSQLIPELRKIRDTKLKFNWSEGLFLFSLGLIKKVIIADNIARGIDPIINDIGSAGFLLGWGAAFGYMVQLYFDFSGYCDMAIGVALLIGIKLPQNFNIPFRSKNPADFWSRWHITLGLWIRDYLFEPLSYSLLRKGLSFPIAMILSLGITMLLAGLWHGANWTFLLFGLYHGLLLLIYYGFKKRWEKLPGPLQHLMMIVLICIGWVFFRAETLADSMLWFRQLTGAGGLGLEHIQQSQLYLFAFTLTCFGGSYISPRWSEIRGLAKLSTRAQVSFGFLTAAAIVLCSYTSTFLYFNF